MESGNSGSLQSSSGGDEEYDSRAADNLFMNTPPPPHIGSISNAPPLFDPLSNYMQQQLHHQNPNSSLLNNPNMAWPRMTPVRSTGHDMTAPIPSFHPPAAIGQGNNNDPGPAGHNQTQAAARNPKKRSRASRRAPTTVLTTDTTNFRAMVQEFTGIPAPPFNSSSFPRTRLDLFGTRSASLDAPPPSSYLRRPFAQKVQSPPPFLSSNTSPSFLSSNFALDAAIAASSTTNNNNHISSISSSSGAAISSSTAPINYQLQMSQSLNLFNNISNPLVNSLLQTNPKFNLFSNSSVMAAKPNQGSFNDIPANDFGSLGSLPSLISSDQIAAAQNDRNDDTHENDNAARWRNNGVGPPDERDGYQAHINSSVNGGYVGGKMNYSASSSTSNSHGQKVAAPENINAATTRGEGMVESWICSSE